MRQLSTTSGCEIENGFRALVFWVHPLHARKHSCVTMGLPCPYLHMHINVYVCKYVYVHIHYVGLHMYLHICMVPPPGPAFSIRVHSCVDTVYIMVYSTMIQMLQKGPSTAPKLRSTCAAPCTCQPAGCCGVSSVPKRMEAPQHNCVVWPWVKSPYPQ